MNKIKSNPSTGVLAEGTGVFNKDRSSVSPLNSFLNFNTRRKYKGASISYSLA
jgi:hypothetical protein